MFTVYSAIVVYIEYSALFNCICRIDFPYTYCVFYYMFLKKKRETVLVLITTGTAQNNENFQHEMFFIKYIIHSSYFKWFLVMKK